MGTQCWIVHIAYHPQICQHAITGRNPIPGTALDHLLATVPRTDTDTADQGFNPIPADIAATVATIHTEDIPGHNIETMDITTGILHDALTPVIIIPTVTPHITDHLHTGPHQLTLGIRADHIPNQRTNQVSKLCLNLQWIPADLKTSCIINKIQESQ